MEDETLIPEVTDNKDEAQKNPPIRKRGPRPDIEGITVPVGGRLATISPKLTSEEKKLIDDAGKPEIFETIKPVSPRIVLPKHRPAYVKWLWTIIFLAALGFGGYSAYLQYINKPEQPTAATEGPYTSLAEKYGDDLTPSGTPETPPAQENTSVATSTSDTTPPPPPPASPTLKITPTPTDFLNVRKEPDLSSAILTKVHPGETYPYIDSKYGWYKITLPNGTVGWVSGQYIQKM